jgi:hypothetical protein
MAESTLSVTINSIRREIGAFIGWGRNPASWSADNITDGDDIIARGLRMFYFPPTEEGEPIYEWSFLRVNGTITLATSDYDYDLTDDFSGTMIDDSVTWASGVGRLPLQSVDEGEIRAMRANDSDAGVPKYIAVRPKTFSPTTGLRYEALVFPTPSAAVNSSVLTYRYVTLPDTLTNTNIYPIGGARHSETILAAVMAAAESRNDDDPAGPYMARFQQMLTASIRQDQQAKDEAGGK